MNSATKHAVAWWQSRTAPMSKRHAVAVARPSGTWRRKSERIVWGSRIGTSVCRRARSSWVANSSGRSIAARRAAGGGGEQGEREEGEQQRPGHGRDHTRGMKVHFFETPAEWRAWLEANHATATEVEVGFRRKATGPADA